MLKAPATAAADAIHHASAAMVQIQGLLMLLSPMQSQAGVAQRQLPCIRCSRENAANAPDGTVWFKGRDSGLP
ncbi:hypothetical protein BRN76_00365 [Xanthomonas oryzae pv. oryzae]|nr:hypothetical protein B9W05_14515 [Xanthomonas oryzae pv. oryzae]AXI19807.1 hypothetical protein CDO19_20270 [Xanthomonas oryzae pv. oryzae]AXI23774.1 hypothetical protein CDO11_20310 [Xanthomonas oryzae pv. oryzae]AXM11876.1 hypothetical protein BRM60_20260 [Xanthomonas oryzae pv. oryzae]AXM19353.1 hypothetical protein BRN66_19995 [Xanthomonas oryzae pv. oryzae]